MKNILVYITIFILVILGIALGLIKTSSTTKSNKKINILNNIDKDIDYYHKDYEKRYIKYKNKNKFLNVEDVITRVNIGLDNKFYTHTKKAKLLNNKYLLVNKYNYLERMYIPNNLVSVDNNFARSGMMLVDEANIAFLEMAKNAKTANMNIRVISSYRPYSYQEQLYNKYKENDGIDKADTYSARPGYSEHQTGLSVDIDNTIDDYNNFEQTKEFKWMKKNAYKYGFILRFLKGKEAITGYQYEAWHYRYVGKEASINIHNDNLCYEEYYVRNIEK